MISQFSSVQQVPYISLPAGKSSSRWGRQEPIDITQVPSLLWKSSYAQNHEELYRVIQHISDYLLQGGPSVYERGNPNQPAARSAYKGLIDQREYQVADSFYGRPGSAKMRDFGFYHSVTQRVIGGALQQPLKFTYTDISPSAIERQVRAEMAQLLERQRRQLVDAMTRAAEENGTPADFSFLTNPDVTLPADELFSAPTQSIEERVGHMLLVNTVKRHKVKDVLRQCREDAIQINARMAHIVADRRGVRPVRLDPDRVHWLAPGGDPIRTDADCDAIGTWDYPSMTEILNQDGHLFENADSIRGLSQTVEQLRDGSPFWYNPRQYWLAGETQRAQPGDTDAPLYLQANWQDKFYPGSDTLGRIHGESIGVLRHWIYFKMIQFLRCRVLLNGKRATPQKMEEFRMRNYHGKMDIVFDPLGEDEKARPGEYIEKFPIVNLWQARRYGHNILRGVQRCTHIPQLPSAQAETRWPIVIHLNHKRSMITLGLDFRRMWNILWNRIEEQLNLGGAESALLIDTAQVSLKESKNMMWQAKKTAVLHYNSARLQSNTNESAKKHLTRVALTNESNTVNNMLALAGLLKAVYDAMIGVGEASQGKAGSYDGLGKLNFLQTQQTAITTEFNYDGNLFDNDVLQRTAEIQKTVTTGGEWAQVSYQGSASGRVAGKRGTRAVFVPKTFADVEPQIELDNGLDLMNIRQKIEALGERVLPSGGASGIREFIKMLFSDDPYEALAIFDSGMSEVEKVEAANAQAQNQNAQMKTQVDAQKAQVPIEVEKIRSETAILINHAKEQAKQQALDAKGDLADIDHNNERQNMVLQDQLDTDQQAYLQQQNAGHQAALQQQDAALDPANPYPTGLVDDQG